MILVKFFANSSSTVCLSEKGQRIQRMSATCYYHRPITEISADEDQTYGKCTKKIQPFVGLSEVFPPDRSTDDFILRRTNTNYFNSYFRTGWKIESTIRNEEEIEKRQKFENPEEMKHAREKLAKYFMEKYKCYTNE